MNENNCIKIIAGLETVEDAVEAMFLFDEKFDEELFGLWLEDIIGFHIDMALGY